MTNKNTNTRVLRINTYNSHLILFVLSVYNLFVCSSVHTGEAVYYESRLMLSALYQRIMPIAEPENWNSAAFCSDF